MPTSDKMSEVGTVRLTEANLKKWARHRNEVNLPWINKVHVRYQGMRTFWEMVYKNIQVQYIYILDLHFVWVFTLHYCLFVFLNNFAMKLVLHILCCLANWSTIKKTLSWIHRRDEFQSMWWKSCVSFPCHLHTCMKYVALNLSKPFFYPNALKAIFHHNLPV